MPVLRDDDNSITVLEIPGLCTGSQLIPASLEPGYVLLLRNGASMEGFHTWYHDDI